MTAPAYRRLPPAERREQILASATDLISARGFAGLTMEAFAGAAGMTAAGLMHHFPSKADLLTAVLQRRDELDLAYAQLFASGPLHDPVTARAVMDLAIERFVEQKALMRLYVVLSAEALDPGHPAHEYFRWRLVEARSRIAAELLPWHPEAGTATVQLLAFIDGLGLTWLRDPEMDYLGQWRFFADRLFAPHGPEARP